MKPKESILRENIVELLNAILNGTMLIITFLFFVLGMVAAWAILITVLDYDNLSTYEEKVNIECYGYEIGYIDHYLEKPFFKRTVERNHVREKMTLKQYHELCPQEKSE